MSVTASQLEEQLRAVLDGVRLGVIALRGDPVDGVYRPVRHEADPHDQVNSFSELLATARRSACIAAVAAALTYEHVTGVRVRVKEPRALRVAVDYLPFPILLS